MAVEKDDWVCLEILERDAVQAEALVRLQLRDGFLRQDSEGLSEIGELPFGGAMPVEDHRTVRPAVIDKQFSLLLDCHGLTAISSRLTAAWHSVAAR